MDRLNALKKIRRSSSSPDVGVARTTTTTTVTTEVVTVKFSSPQQLRKSGSNLACDSIPDFSEYDFDAKRRTYEDVVSGFCQALISSGDMRKMVDYWCSQSLVMKSEEQLLQGDSSHYSSTIKSIEILFRTILFEPIQMNIQGEDVEFYQFKPDADMSSRKNALSFPWSSFSKESRRYLKVFRDHSNTFFSKCITRGFQSERLLDFKFNSILNCERVTNHALYALFFHAICPDLKRCDDGRYALDDQSGALFLIRAMFQKIIHRMNRDKLRAENTNVTRAPLQEISDSYKKMAINEGYTATALTPDQLCAPAQKKLALIGEFVNLLETPKSIEHLNTLLFTPPPPVHILTM
jgi:hypothetical protein